MAFCFMQPKSSVRRIRKNEKESQDILDKLSDYIDSASEEPVRFLVQFWKDQGAVITYAELTKIILAEDVPETVMDDWFQDYSTMLAEKMTPVWKSAIEAGYLSNPVFRGIDPGALHTAEQYVREWATTRTAELVTNCCASQREAIRYLVAEGIDSQMSPDAIGREIRATIGLTRPQTAANVRYYNTVKEQMRKDHPRMTDESIERKVRERAARYAAKQQRERAKMIAQTEVAKAYNEGNDAYVRTAIDQGLMPAMDRVWVVANSDACSLCKGLAGTSVDMNSEFTAHYGIKIKRAVSCSVPPLHPRCRCAVKYVESNGKSGIIKPDKIVSGHASTPKTADPGMVIDHIREDGAVDVRTFYDKDGLKNREIHATNHGNSKHHPYGMHGEHVHDYTWNSEGKLENRTTRELKESERKGNSDIL